MTTRELNRDIKRLNAAIKAMPSGPSDQHKETYYKFIADYAKKEFTRLYFAADDFKVLSKESILILIRLNLRHRFIAFHQFGNKIEI